MHASSAIRPPPPVRAGSSARRAPRHGPDPRPEVLEVRDSRSSVAGAMFAAAVEGLGPPALSEGFAERAPDAHQDEAARCSFRVDPVARLRVQLKAASLSP